MSQMFARQRTMQTDPGKESQLGPPAPEDAPARSAQDESPAKQPAERPAERPTELPAEQPVTPSDAGEAGTATAQPITLQTSPDETAALEGSPDTPFWSLKDFTGSSGLPGLLMAGGAIIIVFILMGRLRRGNRASSPDPRSNKEQIAEIRARAGDRSRIEAFKVDAQDFTRQMAALLDTKAERLEALIADADDRLARLDRASGDHRTSAHGRPQDRSSSTGSDHPAHRSQASAEGDPLHERVYRLSDDGLDAVQIARQTGQPTGQIELILALRA